MSPNLYQGLHNTDVPTLILFSSFKGPVCNIYSTLLGYIGIENACALACSYIKSPNLNKSCDFIL